MRTYYIKECAQGAVTRCYEIKKRTLHEAMRSIDKWLPGGITLTIHDSKYMDRTLAERSNVGEDVAWRLVNWNLRERD